MKERRDILATMAAKLDEGEHGRRISPSIAVDGIKDIKRKLEALYESVITVGTYLNRKDKKGQDALIFAGRDQNAGR